MDCLPSTSNAKEVVELNTDPNNGLKHASNIIFRWCSQDLCKPHDEIYLEPTSISNTLIPLIWRKNLSWHQSEPVHLPTGFYEGFIVIKDKVLDEISLDVEDKVKTKSYESLFKSRISRERRYKIDPFFISPHKYSIELFISSENDCYDEQKFLSSDNLAKNTLQKLNKRWNSFEDAKTKLEEAFKKTGPRLSCIPIEVQTSSPGNNSSNVTPVRPKSILKCKWRSIPEDKSTHTLTNKSVLEERRTTFQQRVQELDLKFHALQSRNIADNTGLSEAERLVFETSVKRHLESLSKTHQQITEQLNLIQLSTDSHCGEIEQLLNSDSEVESEAEIDIECKTKAPSEEKDSYNCLITFESRSASMEDLGSPKAFEDVLVSLVSHNEEGAEPEECVSTVGAQSPDNSSPDGKESKLKKCRTVTETFSNGSFKDNVFGIADDSPEEASGSILIVEGDDLTQDCDVETSRYLRQKSKDVCIVEDENFQYDSLKHEDESIPINVCDLDSDDSSDCKLARSHYKKTTILNIDQTSNSNRSENNDLSPSSNEGKYSLKNLHSPNSANGEIAVEGRVYPNYSTMDDLTNIDDMSVNHIDNTENQKQHTGGTSKKQNSDTYENEPIGTALSDIPKSNKTRNFNERTFYNSAIELRKQFSKSRGNISNKEPPKVLKTTGTQTNEFTHALLNVPFKAFKKPFYTPLPDKLYGPWANKKSISSRVENSPFYKSDLAALQRNLYNLVQNENIIKSLNNPIECQMYDNSKPKYYSSGYLPSDRNSYRPNRYERPQSILKSSHKYTNEVDISNANLPHKMRPASSMPNLSNSINNRNKTEYSHHRRRKSHSANVTKSKKWTQSTKFNISSSSGSTDSLIDEAERFINLSLNSPKSKRNKLKMSEITNNYSSVKSCKRSSKKDTIARAKSEMDLRNLSCKQDESPYIPYSGKQLSLGQLVKVLIAGKTGVATGRIIYIPKDSNILSIILVSGCKGLSGNIISVPFEKILLAWPKASTPFHN